MQPYGFICKFGVLHFTNVQLKIPILMVIETIMNTYLKLAQWIWKLILKVVTAIKLTFIWCTDILDTVVTRSFSIATKSTQRVAKVMRHQARLVILLLLLHEKQRKFIHLITSTHKFNWKKYNTVEPVLKVQPIGHKNVVSQDSWSLVTGDRFSYTEM